MFIAAATGRSVAALHYLDLPETSIPGNIDGIYLNALTGATTILPPPDLNSAPWLNIFFGGTAIGSNSYITPSITAPPTGNGDGLVMKVISMEEIGEAINYAQGDNGSENHTGNGTDQFQSGVPGYLGFAIRSAGGSDVNYGWLRITVNETGAGMIHDRAYQTTPNTPLQAGVIPEPSSAVLFLLAAMSYVLPRRR